MENRNGNPTEVLSVSEKSLQRTKVLLAAAYSEFERNKQLLDRKSTTAKNYQKRLRKARAAGQQIQKLMEAMAEFESTVAEEKVSRLEELPQEDLVEDTSEQVSQVSA